MFVQCTDLETVKPWPSLPVESDHLLLLVLVVVHLRVLCQLPVRPRGGRGLLAARGPGHAVRGVLNVLASLAVAADPGGKMKMFWVLWVQRVCMDIWRIFVIFRYNVDNVRWNHSVIPCATDAQT